MIGSFVPLSIRPGGGGAATATPHTTDMPSHPARKIPRVHAAPVVRSVTLAFRFVDEREPTQEPTGPAVGTDQWADEVSRRAAAVVALTRGDRCYTESDSLVPFEIDLEQATFSNF